MLQEQMEKIHLQLDYPLPPGVIRLSLACDIIAASALRQRSASTGVPMTWKTGAVTDLSEESLIHREVITPDVSIMDEFEEFQSFKRMRDMSRKRCREPSADVSFSHRRSSDSSSSSSLARLLLVIFSVISTFLLSAMNVIAQ